MEPRCVAMTWEVEGGCRKVYGDYGIYVVWLRGDVRGVNLPR